MEPSCDRADPTACPFTSPDLGELVFESKCQDSSRTGFLFGLSVGGVGLLGLLVFLTDEASIQNRYRGLIVSALIGLVGGSLAWFCNQSTPKFRCHKLGVAFLKRKRKLVLLFDQIEAFTYDALVTKVNFGYSHATIKLRFEPVDKSSRAIFAQIVHKARDGDNNLETLKSTVANHIADRMQAQLRGGDPVVWSSWRSVLVFHPQGLEIRDAKNSESGTIVPFEKISGYNFVDGVLHLFLESLPKPVALGTSTRNFYPGFYLLFRITKIPEAPKKLWEQILRIR